MIEIIAHIPDVQSVIISIMMSSNINETLIQNVAAPKKTINNKRPNQGNTLDQNRVFAIENFRNDFPSIT